ncbi:glycosyltransferase family 4 protein (plasmid) [Tundrisphaera sp. TA3]|uniref:glycosyltransferase family 4 protein n=1 Tax=Tundrisphaera sp. TA3 TaxID=3435775 RepID=UPI003EB9CDE0
MKAIHLSAGNLYGGIETLLATLARLRHLAPEVEPEFGFCFRGRAWDELSATDVPVHDLGPVRLGRPWTVWRARARLRGVLGRGRHGAVVIHGPWAHAVFAPEVRRAGIPLVLFAHGESNRSHWLDRKAAQSPPDLVVANSRFTARSAEALMPGTRVEAWHLPVARPPEDAGARPGVRSEFGTADGTAVILQASRLESWKGQAVLLEALGRLRDVPGWECWLAGGVQKPGESEFLAELRSIAGRAGIADRVRFLGDRGDVRRLMAAADVYCQPNLGPEPFGIAIVEALHAGLPVVTSGAGGAAEIVDEACGILTPPGDAAAVSGALRALIEDAPRRGRLGGSGPHRAERLCDPARQLGSSAATLLRLAGRGARGGNPIGGAGHSPREPQLTPGIAWESSS